jgi:D-serine deaminase-like pyridoxal phosphate-dependent protein
MPLPAPARTGDSLATVDTPALLLDLDAFERNLDALDALLAGLPVGVRPHAKSHKCPEIARRQVARGAVGVCCQKVSEAEALVCGGIGDVLVVNEIVGDAKLARLARLARDARVGVAVDDPGNVDDLERAAREADVTLDVLVEVDVGLNRCGVEPGAPAVSLARHVAGKRHLRFAGLQAYQGRAQHVRGFEARRLAAGAAAAKVRATLESLAGEGLKAATVTGGGTGTFAFDAATGAYTEVQPGSYIFMDADYAQNLGEDGGPVRAFEQSLFVLTTVMSHPVPARACVDAGLKAHSVDSGMPVVHAVAGARFTRASDEHGVIELAGPGTLSLGQKIRLVPGHCDPTVNLHDWFVCFRGERVEDIWPITARGAFY